MLSLKTPPALASDLAARVKERRLEQGWSQLELAERAGIKPATYVLFERTGRISLLRLIKVFEVLGLGPQIERLAAADDFGAKTLDAVIAPRRRRGRRRPRA